MILLKVILFRNHWPKNLTKFEFCFSRANLHGRKFARKKQNSNFVKFLGQWWVKWLKWSNGFEIKLPLQNFFESQMCKYEYD